MPENDIHEELAARRKEEAVLCSHIRTALSTPSGQVFKKWLRYACFMDTVLSISDPEFKKKAQLITCLRDLYIQLENYETRGALYDNDE
ncbi:MAG: hypothetical protein LBB60_10570 [Desulfovibrio sp.]|nr:hypothetical protein [Desulfovibrio sp.]